MKENENWYFWAKAEAEKRIPNHERIFGIILVIISILMILYLGVHILQSTGFFTSKFGLLEMFFLFGFFVFYIITSGLQGLLKRRFLSRLVDVFGGVIFTIIAITYLLIVFPFEFAYFANVLPESIRFIVQWISNDIARVIMVLLFIIHLIAVFYSPIAYGFVDKKRFMLKKKV